MPSDDRVVARSDHGSFEEWQRLGELPELEMGKTGAELALCEESPRIRLGIVPLQLVRQEA